MVRLTDQTPPDLRDRLPTPGDDRSALQVGTVHRGVGGFHRTQAMYLNRLMNQLVMVLEPGRTGIADPLLCSKVAALAPALPVGVDGGVGEANVDECLRAGATYLVSGRALLCNSAPVLSAHRPEEKVTRCPRP
jgi:pentose-5-phosphate-3-epimerase